MFELLGQNLYDDLKQDSFKGYTDIENKLKPIVFQIVQGLNYLKHCDIVHCDMKPENLIYSDATKDNIKIIDFGSASYHGQNTYSYV